MNFRHWLQGIPYRLFGRCDYCLRWGIVQPLDEDYFQGDKPRRERHHICAASLRAMEEEASRE
jgi:hypothetical protein